MKKINENNLLSMKELDLLSIKELIDYVLGVELVTVEGYGGENKFGDIPKYVDSRVCGQLEYLEGSENTYSTWDSYTLYKSIDIEPLAVQRINKNKTSGSSVIFKLVNYKRKLIVNHIAK